MPLADSRTQSPSHAPKECLIAHGAGIGIFLILRALSLLLPDLVYRYFPYPAARLASLFLGGGFETSPEGGVTLFYRSIEISVISECSGFAFFSLLCALFIGLSLYTSQQRQSNRRWLREIPVLILAAWIATILTNAIRMICAIQTRHFTSGRLPESYHSAIHMAVGMIVFIPALFVTWHLLQRIYENRSR